MLPQTLVILQSIFVIFILFLLATIFHSKRHKKNGIKIPPGPKPLPIIGNLHMLGKLPHRTFQSLSKKYGPIMSFKLGQIQTIVVSSPQTAELFLKTHDSVFSSRPTNCAFNYLSYDKKGIIFANGDYWRSMRKLCNIQLFHNSKVEMFAPLRKHEVGLLVKSLRKSATLLEAVDVTKAVAELIENISYKMILGRSKDDKFDLKGLVHEQVALFGMFNVSDYLPLLRPFDLQGIQRKCKKTLKQLDELLEHIIKEHENPSIEEQKFHHNKDFVDILLSLMNQPIDSEDKKYDMFDRTNIKALILDLISAAIDTTSVLTDWVLSQLLKHPNAMKRLQHELQNVVGMNRQVEETHLANLPYLSMVMKETFRLCPIGPLLPHECLEDAVVDGYYIKKNSIIFINEWTIGRDTKVWSDNAELFYPERFEDDDVDIRGHDFRLFPFGSGRRSCPGMQMGLTTAKLVVAQLMHCFNWELPDGMSPDDLDMSEKFELTMLKTQPLLAVPTYRLVV